MKLKFKLDAANLKLSKAEVLILLNAAGGKLNGKYFTITTKITIKKLKDLCERSSLIKECYSEKPYFYWKAKPGRFIEREPTKKPAFHPTLLKPKLARTLINLSGAEKGYKLLDPFCGLGSILLEASILGIKATGSDLSNKAISGSRTNLKYYKKRAKVVKCDATKLDCFKEKFDAIVTDPPYGVSSKVHAKNTKQLYNSFIKVAQKVLKKNGTLVFMCPDKIKLKIPKTYVIENKFDIYVHRRLTRKVHVLRKC